MIVKTFPDGSELNAGTLVAALVVGTTFGIAVAAAKEKISDIRFNRWMKKNDYRQGGTNSI